MAAAALNAAKQLLPQWFPAGRWEGHEFLVGNLGGEAGDSLRINSNTGMWADFAGDDKGGDLVSLYAAIHGLKQGQAARELGEALGMSASTPAPPGSGKPGGAEKVKALWVPIVPAPEDAPAFSLAHHHYGKPVASWAYLDAEGRLIGYVCRFDSKTRGKEIMPAVWARSMDGKTADGKTAWRWLSFPKPRPLYRLDDLAQRSAAPVLVVEGEKTADAAGRLFPHCVVMTWPGGAKAVGKANWKPLAGRRVVIWPDADEAGLAAAEEIARALSPIAESVQVVSVPPGVAQGWDLADAEAEGWAPERAQRWARENLVAAAAGPDDRPPEPTEDPGEGFPTQIGAGATRDGWKAQIIWERGAPAGCEENVLLILEHHPAWKRVLWWDEFSTRVVARRKPPIYGGRAGEWTETMDLELKLWLTQQCGVMVKSMDNIRMGIKHSSSRHVFHPVREYLNALHHDGTPRVRGFFGNYMDVPPGEYAELTSLFFLLGMVARAYEPGCPMRLVPILEGEQYKGKSAALAALGGEWFSDTPFVVGDKDAYLSLRGCWLYEIAEYDSFSRAESTRVKAFVSSRRDNFRAPYDRQNAKWPRQCVFSATTNQDEYFKDPTGNTRFAPVVTGLEIKVDAIERDRDQIFAEAVQLYRQGVRRYATQEEQRRLFTPEQDLREVEDPWFSLIATWAAGRMRSGAKRITQIEILEDCLGIETSKIDNARQMSTRVGVAMHRAGWFKRRETLKTGGRAYYYERPQVDSSSKQGGDDDADTVPF